MIEEEDDEDVLKKGVSLKSVLKNLLVLFLIILGLLIIYIGTGADQITNFIFGFSILCFATTLLQYQKEPKEPLRQTLTILICGICGLTKVRNFQQGDFVFKKSDVCEKCKTSMEIKQIYSVKLKKPTESMLKEKTEKKE
ncbi:MAG: hypothetical protein ACTSVV_13735 [Promethearchaeota archaeon]